MRTDRYRNLLPVDRLRESACTIIGVGAIGRQVGLQLAAMGVGRAQLIDFDTVEEANLGTQAYLQDDVGRPKVQATADLMQQLNHQLDVEEVAERFSRSLRVHPVFFCCVDSITTRRHIWNAIGDRVDLFVDGRMAAEVVRVLAVADSCGRAHYLDTLFNEDQAFPQACTARSTIYSANVAAGLMVSVFVKWLRGILIERDITFNVLGTELSVNV